MCISLTGEGDTLVQLDGTLEKFPLRELIEMVVYSSVTGVLELAVGDGIGRLFFRDGRPYHAVAGEQVGADAVAAMFEERDAPFGSSPTAKRPNRRCGWTHGS
jgi:hypothetical protein